MEQNGCSELFRFVPWPFLWNKKLILLCSNSLRLFPVVYWEEAGRVTFCNIFLLTSAIIDDTISIGKAQHPLDTWIWAAVAHIAIVSGKPHQNEPPRKPENIKELSCPDAGFQGGFFHV